MNRLRSFHHRSARFITGQHVQQVDDNEWFFSCMEEVLGEAKLETLDEYIRRRWETITPFVRTRPIFDACLNSTGGGGSPRKLVWWQLMERSATVE